MKPSKWRGKTKAKTLAVAVLGLVAVFGLLLAMRRETTPTLPTGEEAPGPWAHPVEAVLHAGGRPWNIGYYQGGPWGDYPKHFRGLIHGLMELGWIGKVPVPEPEAEDDTAVLWSWLAEPGRSDCVSFSPDAYYCARWDEERRASVREELLNRLMTRELDLVLAMGTWAGQDLASDEHEVPVIVCSTSDPVTAGIIESPDDSGLDHVHAMCDPDRYVRQVSAYHNIVGFRRLGIVYENTEEGRVYACLREVRRVAAMRGFEVVERHVREVGIPERECVARTKKAIAEIAPLVDALWIGAQVGQTSEHLPDVLEPLFEHRVATWSIEGSEAVKRGVLLSVAEGNFKAVGLFYARVVASVLNGVKPRRIVQRFRDPLALTVNLETARRIDFPMPESLVKAADRVYETIQGTPGEGDVP